MADQSEILNQLLEDFLTRIREGQRPDPEEYAQRYPDLALRIRQLFPTAGLMEKMAAEQDSKAVVPLAANPYMSRLMIEEPAGFFGRSNELSRIFSRIGSVRPQSVAVVGERRIGKSSLLEALTWPDIRGRFLNDPGQAVTLFIDFQQLPGISRNGFFDLLLEKVREKIDLERIPEEDNRYLLMQAILGELRERNRPLIFLFDEFDAVTSNEAFGAEFFSFLRSCANNYPVAFVTSSRSDLQTLCHSSAIADSPFFNIFSSLYLRGFSLEEASELIDRPSAACGLPLAPYRSQLLALAGTFPFYLQIACSVYFEALAGGREISEGKLRHAFLEEASPHFTYFWEHIRPEEKELLRKIAAGRQPEPDQLSWCTRLERSAYLIKEEGLFRPFSQAFARQISQLDSLSDSGVPPLPQGVEDSFSKLSRGQEIQQYRVIRELGKGGMGVVYLAEDRSLRRRVVLKLCRPELVASTRARQRAIREARTAAALRHSAIAIVHELLEYHGSPVIVMEWIEGKNLAQLLQEEGPPSWRRICRWMADCCEALEYAHREGLIHRDIKPSNLLITSEGTIKLTDFGLAKRRLPKAGSVQLTFNGSILGTLNYMSPEQARGAPVDQRSDLFSLGVVCFEALTGKLPFQRPDLPSTLHAILHDPLPYLGLYGVENASALDKIIQRLVAKRPRDRFQTAAEAAQAFDAALRGRRSWLSRLRPPWRDSSGEA